MLNQQIDYASLVEQALLRVVHDVLDMVAEQGLPGRHHLYITFRTDHPGVAMDGALQARYPSEMTIVLQHEFWGLEVSDDRFAVTLTFNSVSQRLEVPFAAVTVFADPSVEFGLQFTRASAPVAQEEPSLASLPTGESPSASEGSRRQGVGQVHAVADQATDVAGEAAEKGSQTEGAHKVVTLDRFRKK